MPVKADSAGSLAYTDNRSNGVMDCGHWVLDILYDGLCHIPQVYDGLLQKCNRSDRCGHWCRNGHSLSIRRYVLASCPEQTSSSEAPVETTAQGGCQIRCLTGPQYSALSAEAASSSSQVVWRSASARGSRRSRVQERAHGNEKHLYGKSTQPL